MPDGHLAAALAALALGALLRPLPAAAEDREFVILAVNDVYRIAGVDAGRKGGLARLRTLRRELAADHPDLLMLHGGDVVSPSFVGRLYKGAKMVEMLNMLDDGKPARRFDDRMFVVFGNHEFDNADCRKPEILRQPVAESDFTWLATNIRFDQCGEFPPMLAADRPNVVNHRIVTAGGVKVGPFGLGIHLEKYASGKKRYPGTSDNIATAFDATAKLREDGAEVVVAVTHLAAADDERILRTLGDDGPDLIIGGHNQNEMIRRFGSRAVYKADADAATASVVTVRVDGASKVTARHRFASLDEGVAKDPTLEAAVQRIAREHEAAFCRRAHDKVMKAHAACPGGAAPVLDASCLSQALGRTNAILEAEELKNRGAETGIGDWLADLMRTSVAGAEVALINSGTLRLNYDLPAGATLYRRLIEELFGFDVPLVKRTMTGAQIWAAVAHGLKGRGEGPWPHVSGVAEKLDADGNLAALKVRRADGTAVALTPASTETSQVTTSEFLAGGGDGYVLPKSGDGDAAPAEKCAPAAGAVDLKDLTLKAIVAAGDKGIDPVKDGRVCELGRTPYLHDAWR